MATSCTGSAEWNNVHHRALILILNAVAMMLTFLVAIAVLLILVGLVAVLAVHALLSLVQLL